MARLVGPGGNLLVRDLARPANLAQISHLVETYTASEPEAARALFEASLHAALTIDEVRDIVRAIGLPAESVTMTSDRHWTWLWERPKAVDLINVQAKEIPRKPKQNEWHTQPVARIVLPAPPRGERSRPNGWIRRDFLRMLTTQSPPRDVLIPVADGPAPRAWFWTRAIPRAMLVISHGFGEHGGCYRHLADALGPALGIEILSFDFRGHGRSPGRRGVVRNYDDLTVDLESALTGPRSRGRIFAGSCSDTRTAARSRSALRSGDRVARRPDSSNPVIELATEAPRYKVAIGHLLRRFAPGVTLRRHSSPTRWNAETPS